MSLRKVDQVAQEAALDDYSIIHANEVEFVKVWQSNLHKDRFDEKALHPTEVSLCKRDRCALAFIDDSPTLLCSQSQVKW